MADIDRLRREKRALRAALDADSLERAAHLLAQRIVELPAYREAGSIAAYFAVNGEIDPAVVIESALAAGKRVYLPHLDGEALRFAPYFHGQKMRLNRFRLPEPDVDRAAMLAPRDLDLVLVPLVAFDRERNRVGMGGGYYDRSFAFRQDGGPASPLLVGIAHEQQRVDALKPQAWDVRLDLVVTDAGVYA